nr:carboxylesterase family protein [Kutzneria sp. CA-103260]
MRAELRGVEKDGVWTYYGVPYAMVTDRFGPPGPAPAWAGVLDATTPGPTAPQGARSFAGTDMSAILGTGWDRGDPYLTLNIWSTQRQARPVMVYVHGGGFLSGSGHASMYDGTDFARDGVVLVTLNYRLGAIGWLDLPGAPRNRGLLDVIAALRWIRDHIGEFGGAPDNVTLFGQSAGAMLIAALLSDPTLLADPAADGLVRRAISQSGGAHMFGAEQADRVTRALAERLGIEPSLDAFQQVSDENLVEATAGLVVDTRFDRSLGTSPFKPVVDDLELAPVDLLIGTNEDEAGLYVHAPVTDEDVVKAAARRDPDPERLVAEYRRRFAEPLDQLTALLTEQFETGSTRIAQAHRGKVWAYRFGLGGAAIHCAELPFVFRPGPVHDAWVRFATVGDPGWDLYPSVQLLTGRG